MILQPGKDKQQHSSVVSFVQAVGKYSSCCSVLFVKQQARAKCLNRRSKNKNKTEANLIYLSHWVNAAMQSVSTGYTELWLCMGGNAFARRGGYLQLLTVSLS